MTKRFPIIVSVVALLVACLGATPFGQAAGSVVATIVPYAKMAGAAKNAAKLNGHRSSTAPRASQIPVLDRYGKLPASVGAVGPQGPPGRQGNQGPKGEPSGRELDRSDLDRRSAAAKPGRSVDQNVTGTDREELDVRRWALGTR